MAIIKKKKKKDEDIAPVKSNTSTDSNVLDKARDIIGGVIQAKNTIENTLNPIKRISTEQAQKGQNVATKILNGETNFFKESKSAQEIKDIWSDGFQRGDVKKTIGSVNKTMAGTVGDATINILKGNLQTAEGLVDFGRYNVADVLDYIGNSNSKTVLGTTGNILADQMREKAKENTTEKFFSSNKDINTLKYGAATILDETIGKINPATSAITQKIKNDAYNAENKDWAKQVDEYSIFDSTMDQINQSVGQQSFRVGLAHAIGGTGASPGTTKALNQLEIFAGSYGSAKSDALNQGASMRDATIRGFISGTSELISENLFDSLPGFKTYEVGGVSKLKDLIGKSAEKAFGGNAGKAAIRIFGGLGEGVEEILSNGLETAFTDIANLVVPVFSEEGYTYGMEEGQGVTDFTKPYSGVLKIFKDIYKSGTSKESKEAFITALFSTLITCGISSSMNESQRKEVIQDYAKDNNISVEKATELFDAVRDLKVNEIANEDTSYSEKVELEDQVSQQLVNEINESKKTEQKTNLEQIKNYLTYKDTAIDVIGQNHNLSSEGLDLVDSYRAYNGKTKNTTEIAQVQKYFENRGIYGREDASAFIGSNETAKWINENGQRTVLINPNATTDQIIQNIATHEMTHDIMSNKTDTNQEMFNSVLDYAKTQENYKEMRADLEKAYSEYYKNKSQQEFSQMIDEEIVANTLGEHLGTQEYVNRIVNQNPSLAQNIYNWVVDKLQNYNKNTNNKGEVIGYKSDRLYWEGVKNRFEKAYNEQKTATTSKDTRYMFMGEKGLNNAINNDISNKNLDYRLKRAKQLANETKEDGTKYTNEEIRQATRWFQDENGKWLFEISDKDANFDDYKSLQKNHKYNLDEVFSHSALFEAYPNLKNTKIQFKDIKNTKSNDVIGGTYNTFTKTITLNNILLDKNSSKAAKKIILHELQHKIQQYEGLEKGDEAKNLIRYYTNLGEIQASEVESRSDYDYSDILKNPPKSSQKNPVHDFIEWVHDNPNTKTAKEALNNKDVAELYNEIYNNGKEGEYNRVEINKKGSTSNKTKKGIFYNKGRRNNSFISNQELDDSSFSLQENNQLRDRAKQELGITTDLKEAGYLTTDGQYIDFSGKKHGGQPGRRSMDHREIADIYTDEEYDAAEKKYSSMGTATAIMQDFIDKGNIRLMPEQGVDISLEPTSEQYDKLYDYLDFVKRRNGEVYVDLETETKNRENLQYNEKISTSKIINDIKNHYANNNTETRYSLSTNKDSDGDLLTKGQQEYFKDSKVVDSNGNLMVVYHGSRNEYTTYEGGGFFTDDYWNADGYASGEVVDAVYLNMKRPLMLECEGRKWDDLDTPYGTSTREIAGYVESSNEYDGVIFNNIADSWMDDVEAGTSTVYYIKESNQAKRIDNANPTDNIDTRYSLTTNNELENYINNNGFEFRDNGNLIVNNLTDKQIKNLVKIYHNTGYDDVSTEYLENRLKEGNMPVMREVADRFIEKELGHKPVIDKTQIFEDAEGNKLTKEQVEFYKNSDVRDIRGRLIPVYHRTNAKFTVFDPNAGTQNGKKYGKGFYFSITPENYGNNTMKVYLNAQEGDFKYIPSKGYYIVQQANQIKNVNNLNPTENEDIRYSLGTNKEIDNNNIAPIREDISNLSEQVNNLSKQLETIQNQSEIAPRKGYVEQFRQQRYENQDYTPMTQEDADLYQQSLLNDEAYLKSLDEQAETEENNTKIVNRITNEVQNRLGLGKKQRDTLSKIVENAITDEYTTDEIARDLEKNFAKQEYTYPNEDAREVKKLIRNTPLKVSDGIKTDIPDYGSFQKNNFNKITFSKNGIPVDVAYQSLNEQMPVYFPNNITNPTDQLMKIAEVANIMNDITETIEISPDEFDNIADYIRNSYLEDKYNSQMNGEASLNKDIQFNMTDEILPTTIRSQESIDNYIDNRDIAPVRETTPIKSQQTTNKEKATRMGRSFQEMFINRNYVIDQYAKATGNKYIKFAGDDLNNVSGEAQYNINNKQTDFNGNWIGKGVHEIFEPARQAGLYEAFNDYLIQKSNIERHSLGKGSQVPLAVSQELVSQYESENPQFKEWAKDVYTYFDNVLQEQVDAGLITQEQYDTFRGENGIYRSYVPFYEGDIDKSRYFDNDGNIKAVSTLKRAKGGATDVSQMLAVEDSMARQTFSYKKAIRQNELYKQIVSTQQKYENLMDQDVRSNPTDLEDSLFITPDGERIVTAYVDGNRVSAQISEDLFNELTKENENRVRQFEEDYSLITNPLQKASNIRRNLITTWNPVFLARNAIKDIQDAAINSKHTGDMLKNYYGLNKTHTPALVELAQAKTNEAKQFLALYGAENLYGDYSNVNGKGIIKSFSRANELIELSPRFAEFKASLQNGESVQEAIYNAREVTTNFGRGGYISKALNRNGFTFLNANIQGLDKVVRNLSGENGVKGVTSVVVKGAMFAVLPSIINHLMFGSGDDKDEEYEALPDYIKDNYYLIKLESGKFLRIPKGRINSVFGSAARRLIEAFEGEENAFEGYGKNAWSQIGVGDSSGLQTIFTPLSEAFGSKNGTSWYGGDIVPTRLQNKPAAEQYDEKTDELSKFLGEKLNISPKKINYILDQYSGGIGDVLLPMMTPATTSGAETPLEYLVAPVEDTFIVNSTDDNKYAGKFYDLKDKLEVQHNSQYATDDDILKYKYMSNVSSQMSELYKEKREIQSSTVLSQKEKYAKVQAIQNEINTLAKNALNNYDNYTETENYASIGEFEYYKDNDGEWSKVSESDSEFTAGMTDSEKTSYFNVKNKINSINTTYNNNIKDITDESLKKQYQSQKKNEITQAIVNSGLDNYTKAMVYAKYYSSEKTMRNVVNSGYDVNTYITALYDIEEIRNKYSQANGYSTAERKARTIAYINSLQMNVPQKAMLIRTYYSSFKGYNGDIVNYVNNLDITVEEKKTILDDNGFKVDGNRISW